MNVNYNALDKRVNHHIYNLDKNKYDVNQRNIDIAPAVGTDYKIFTMGFFIPIFYHRLSL